MSSVATAMKISARPAYPSEFVAYRRNTLAASTILFCCCFFLSESARINVLYSSVAFEFGSPAYVRLVIALVLLYELAQFYVVGRNSQLEWHKQLVPPAETFAEIEKAISSIQHRRPVNPLNLVELESKIEDIKTYISSPEVASAIAKYNDYRTLVLDIQEQWSEKFAELRQIVADEQIFLSELRASLADQADPVNFSDETLHLLIHSLNSKIFRYVEADQLSQQFFHGVFDFEFQRKLDQISTDIRELSAWPMMQAETNISRQIQKLQRILAQADKGIRFEVMLFDGYAPFFIAVSSLGFFIHKDGGFLIDRLARIFS